MIIITDDEGTTFTAPEYAIKISEEIAEAIAKESRRQATTLHPDRIDYSWIGTAKIAKIIREYFLGLA